MDLGPGGTYVLRRSWRDTCPKAGSRRSVAPTGDFCASELMDHGGGGNRPRGLLQTTDITLCCTHARSSWSLIPTRLGQAGAGLRYLVPSLALLLMFLKPSVCVCLSFPPTRSHPSRLDAADPGPPGGKRGGEQGQGELSGEGTGTGWRGTGWELRLLQPCCPWLWVAVSLQLEPQQPPPALRTPSPAPTSHFTFAVALLTCH